MIMDKRNNQKEEEEDSKKSIMSGFKVNIQTTSSKKNLHENELDRSIDGKKVLKIVSNYCSNINPSKQKKQFESEKKLSSKHTIESS